MNNNANNNEKGKKRFVEVFDILFIMILCFITLLTTMLVRGSVLVGSGSAQGMDYSIKLTTFFITIAGFAVYLLYILPHSNKELKKMISELYKNDSNEAN